MNQLVTEVLKSVWKSVHICQLLSNIEGYTFFETQCSYESCNIKSTKLHNLTVQVSPNGEEQIVHL